MSKETGGPAFPLNKGTFYDSGMTLRDWFASMALMGLNANPEIEVTAHEASVKCYEQADAMLKEREK